MHTGPGGGRQVPAGLRFIRPSGPLIFADTRLSALSGQPTAHLSGQPSTPASPVSRPFPVCPNALPYFHPGLPLAQQQHFRYQPDPAFPLDGVLDVPHQGKDILGRRAAVIDDEIGV